MWPGIFSRELKMSDFSDDISTIHASFFIPETHLSITGIVNLMGTHTTTMSAFSIQV